MSAPEFVRTGWACVTDTMCGLYVALEGSTPEDVEPVIFVTREEAEAERADYMDMTLEAHEFELEGSPEEIAEGMEAQRQQLEDEELIMFVGVDRVGDVYEIDPETRAIGQQLHRPDR